MNKYSFSALVAAGLLAGGLSAGSASAADLGGNCCADLEERIAELEATTARKGNRKVSLTISGWVGQQVTFWDDGQETNVYVHDLGSTLASHVKFTGQATISPGWTAGYVLHIEALGSDSLTMDQGQNAVLNSGPRGPAAVPLVNGGTSVVNGVQVVQSYWFVKSEQLGKVGVGLQSQASDNTAILVDGSGSLVPANWVAFDVNAFMIRGKGGTADPTIWGNIGGCRGGGAWGDCNGVPRNVVRYDSPTFAGFSVSASWGEDDMWDVAARWSGEHSGFKLALAGAYNELSDEGYTLGSPPKGDTFKYFQIGGYAEHIATGLFVYSAYGHSEFDKAAGDSDTWYIKAGIRQRWNPLGHTVLYGEYENVDADGAFANTGTSDSLDLWGLGVVQEVDAAAMSVWLKYRNLSYDNNVAGAAFDDFNEFAIGGLINF